MEKKISVILVNYNGKKYNTACIDSILQSMDCYNEKTIRKQIIIVDNASVDDSVAILKKKYCIGKQYMDSMTEKLEGTDSEHQKSTQMELILLNQNCGFAAANNKGIKRAEQWGADYILLLNNDTEIAPDMIKYLLECADRHPQSMIVPKIYYSDDRRRIWSAGGSISPVVKKIRHDGLNQIDKGQFEIERKIAFATGCCLLIPRTVLSRAGMLDERFFLYYEDVEYSFRLQKEGISIYYCPKAYMYHKVGASSKGAMSPLCAYYISRNWLLCNREHLKRRYPVFLLYYAVNRAICCLVWLLQRKPELVRAALRGMKDYWNGRFGESGYDMY